MTRKQSLAMKSLRYIPVYAALASVANVGLLLMGYETRVLEMAIVLAGFWMINVFSVVFKFCFWHRLCLNYTLAMFVLVWLRRYAGMFVGWVTVIRVVMLVVGGLILWMIVRRRVCWGR